MNKVYNVNRLLSLERRREQTRDREAERSGSQNRGAMSIVPKPVTAWAYLRCLLGEVGRHSNSWWLAGSALHPDGFAALHTTCLDFSVGAMTKLGSASHGMPVAHLPFPHAQRADKGVAVELLPRRRQ